MATEIGRIKYISDVCFAEVNGQNLKLDILTPMVIPSVRIPAVVYIHGGGWNYGEYKMLFNATDDYTVPSNYRMPLNYKLAMHNFCAVSIEYRFSGKAKFPAQIEDCRAAIKWLRVNADKCNIDVNHIGVWGHSAGGHLAALLGTTTGMKELQHPSETDGVSCDVQAVADMCGPIDFSKITKWLEDVNAPTTMLLGGTIKDNLEKAEVANPITYINSNSAVFQIIHGEDDDVIPIEQSELLYDSLKAQHIEVEFIRVKNANHSFEGENIRPGWDEMDEIMVDFFNKHLRKSESEIIHR